MYPQRNLRFPSLSSHVLPQCLWVTKKYRKHQRNMRLKRYRRGSTNLVPLRYFRAPEEKRAMSRVLITGASRGLGLEFARQYAADGWDVIATARNPKRSGILKELAKDKTVS